MRRLLGVAAVLALAGCSDDDPAPAETVDLRVVADRLACERPTPIPEQAAPIRGGAATRGLACVGFDLFERAPDGDEPSARGGSLENIDRLVGTGADPGCAFLVVTDTWFVVAAERKVAERAADLGGAVRGVEPVSPPASYACPTAGP